MVGQTQAPPEARAYRLAENLISALLFLPVVYQYDWLTHACPMQAVDLAGAMVRAMKTLGVVAISAMSLMATVICHRFIFRKIFWRPIALSTIGAVQMICLVLSHGGNGELLRCGVGGAAAVAVLVMLAAGPRLGRELGPRDIGVLIGFLSLMPFILEMSVP